MQTSADGIVALEAEEGVVLKAYPDVVGVWTIGAGLTAASGVVKPKAGMVISREEATALLSRALERNYEPRVEKAMRGLRGSTAVTPKQNEFDAGVSFDFNTGAIHKAGWVRRWIEGAAPSVIRAALGEWKKGGGKVLPGLVARRKREADMLLRGIYRGNMPVAPTEVWAGWGLTLSSTEKADAREALRKLGYAVGGKIDAIALAAAKAFQRDHALTVDGIIGRATLTTLQRRLDATQKAMPALGATAVAGTGTATGAYDALGVPPSVDWMILGVFALIAAWTAFRYRDVIAAKIAQPLPRVAALLRSF